MRRLIWVIGAAVLCRFAVPLAAALLRLFSPICTSTPSGPMREGSGRKVCPYASWSPRDPGKPDRRLISTLWFTGHPDLSVGALTAPTDANDLRDRGIAMLTRFNMLALAGGAGHR
jgi:hypothetical protein